MSEHPFAAFRGDFEAAQAAPIPARPRRRSRSDRFADMFLDVCDKRGNPYPPASANPTGDRDAYERALKRRQKAKRTPDPEPALYDVVDLTDLDRP